MTIAEKKHTAAEKTFCHYVKRFACAV